MKTPINCLIVDDELHARELLKTLLSERKDELNIVDEAASLDEAKEKITKYQPDLVFLDIKLKHQTAFDLLDSLGEINFQIIFTTAYNEFAIDAFEYFALHYLLKPINIEQLEDAVDRAVEQAGQREIKSFSKLLAKIKTLDQQKIALPNRTGDEFVLIKNIICCTASGSYTNLTLKGGKTKLVSKPLAFFEKKLNSEMFIRTHKKYIVNLLEVVALDRGRTPVLTLSEQIRIDVSLTYKSMVLERLGDRIQF